MLQKVAIVCMSFFMMLTIFSTGYSDEYPSKPIQLICSFSAGGGSDITARTIAPFLAKELGQNVVVVNKTGAGGEIGHKTVANAAPDGYTLGIANTPPMLSLPIERDTGFTFESFTLIGNLVTDPSALSVPMDSQFKTAQDFMDYARKNPNAVTIGFTGVGTDDYLWIQYFMKETGIKLTLVPFDGSNNVRTSMIGNHIIAGAVNFGEMMPHSSIIRILAQMDTKRSSFAPNVPTMTELGVNVVMRSERGIIAPKNLPGPVADRLRNALKNIAANPELKDKIEKQFTILDYIPADDWDKQLRKEDQKLRQLWKENPWKS
jgi:tripartite-type tricarboxylate transporter receptor subunit TctC